MSISEFLLTTDIAYEKDVLLSRKTWIKTGGICSFWIIPNSIKQLTEVCRYLYSNGIKFDIIGQASNIFFHSSYNPEVVVTTTRVNNYIVCEDQLDCDCGVSVVKLSKDCMSKGYAGFFGLVGLPGTVASAVINNAGCFSCSISEMLISAEVLMPDGTIKTFETEDFGYEKRSSRFKRGEVKGVVLSVKLKLQKAENIENEYRKSEETKLHRKKYQEGSAKNLGSVFADRKMRVNMRNRMASFITVKLAKVGLIRDKNKTEKNFLLFLYGYTDLNPYISDKNINTFIWKDNKAEMKFERYKEFMGKVNDSLVIEIEEKK